MYRKILDALTILSKYVTSEQFKAKMMNQVLENVQGLMPDVLNNALPNTTGKSIQLPFKK